MKQMLRISQIVPTILTPKSQQIHLIIKWSCISVYVYVNYCQTSKFLILEGVGVYPMTQSVDISKNFNFQIKSKLMGKIRHFGENCIFFHMYIKSRNIIYIQTRFQLKNYHATSSNQTRCVCRILMN